MSQPHIEALAWAEPHPFWSDQRSGPDAEDTLVRTEHTDLCIVGGGYTGLWTAILAKERDPSRDVVLIEGDTCGSGASGRNGGFMEASLTHGVANGQQHFPSEVAQLERLGFENLDAIEDTISRYNIDCAFERTGVIDVVTYEPYLDEIVEDHRQLRSLGQEVELLDREQMQAQVHSPTYIGGLWRKDRAALVDPVRLAWGLKRAALALGVRVYEHTKATGIERDGVGVLVKTPFGSVRAARVALATNAYPPLLRQMKNYIVPVYDYCMATEPLSSEQLDSIGWAGRQGLSDTNNQFHYYRLTEDNRIIWGGYDAVYFFGSKHAGELDQRPETFMKLSEHFFTTFPQLEGLHWENAWGGAIDTCTRFCVFWGTSMRGRVAYAAGYTGLGVASTLFGGQIMLDLLHGRRNEVTDLEFVRRKPLPWPPEPFRFVGIQLSKHSLDREDKTGKRNLWLRSLDRLGLGFDS